MKEIEIIVDKNNKVDLSQVIQMKIEYESQINKLKEQINDILIGCYSVIEKEENENVEILCRKLYKYGYLQKSNGNWVLNRSYDE